MSKQFRHYITRFRLLKADYKFFIIWVSLNSLIISVSLWLLLTRSDKETPLVPETIFKFGALVLGLTQGLLATKYCQSRSLRISSILVWMGATYINWTLTISTITGSYLLTIFLSIPYISTVPSGHGDADVSFISKIVLFCVGLGGLLSGIISGLLQFVTISKYVSQARLWLFASAICGASNVMIYYRLFVAEKSQYSTTDLIAVCAGFGIFYGLISGVAMVLMPPKFRENRL
jgi:hypothetical protein